MSSSLPTVVVVDDSSSVLEFFGRIQDTMDVELQLFASAAAAMEYLEKTAPDLLFLDIIMPEKDGLTFLQELRRMPLHAATVTVMISSKDYAQDRVAAKELGAVEFVAKPMSTQTIKNLIAKYTSVAS